MARQLAAVAFPDETMRTKLLHESSRQGVLRGTGVEARRPIVALLAWLGWFVGIAVCAAVIYAVTHLSEEEEFLRLLRRAEPEWLVLALVLQAGTYQSEAWVWRILSRRAGHVLPMAAACQLSLAKLFINQSLPSGGVSGLALVTGALDRLGLSPVSTAKVVLVDLTSYYFAFALCLAAGLFAGMQQESLPMWCIITAIPAVLVGVAVAWMILAFPREHLLRRRWLSRVSWFRDWLAAAGPASQDGFRLAIRVLVFQCLIFLLDVATMSVSIRALGIAMAPTGVFASFMAATMFRVIGFIPGGLGPGNHDRRI